MKNLKRAIGILIFLPVIAIIAVSVVVGCAVGLLGYVFFGLRAKDLR